MIFLYPINAQLLVLAIISTGVSACMFSITLEVIDGINLTLISFFTILFSVVDVVCSSGFSCKVVAVVLLLVLDAVSLIFI